VLVEYGPGVGTFTREILRRMRSDAVLVVLETNADFVRYLSRGIQDDRLRIVHGSAAEADAVLAAQRLGPADYVISGIPYTTMPAEVRETILRKTHAVLGPDGAFLVYQFTRAVLPYLQRVFGLVDQDFEPLNVMPARLFYCRHHANGNGGARATNGRRKTRRREVPEPIERATPPRSYG
jgi:phospholipid N-methyltransferase